MKPAGSEGVREVESPRDRIVLRLDLPGVPPDRVFRYWVNPPRLRAWWVPDSTVEPKRGGAYVFRWPAMGWTLRGNWIRFEPGVALEFTWRWDHEPTVTKRVLVAFQQLPGGTRLVVEHGPYGSDPRDDALRLEHLDGWKHFLGQLQNVLRPRP